MPAPFNFADIWEAIHPEVAARTALVCGAQRRTYAELAERVNRLSHHLQAAGVGPGDRVAIFLRNCGEYLETMLAAFSLRAVPVNVNYRYVADELRYLLDDSESVALVFGRSQGPAVDALGRSGLRTALVIDDDEVAGIGSPPNEHSWVQGSTAYEEALAGQPASPVMVAGRSGDDHYLMYTGGTTGLPKGVLWRQEDAFFACLGGGDPTRMQGAVARPDELPGRIAPEPTVSYLPVAPLMHAAAQWTTLSWLFAGGKTTLMPGALDAEAVWQAVQEEKVNMLTVVGDAVGRPLLRAWRDHPGRWDASSLFAISNGGAAMSPSLKARLAEEFPELLLIDGFGSSETGAQGSQRLKPGDAGRGSGLARFTPYDNTTVLGDDLRPVAPGSEVVGRVALRGRIPLGYLNDPEKTASTFVLIEGVRHVLTGDMATVADDGTVELLGRGSQCINTGGEKVFPEEVEAILHGHPGVDDVLVVGVPDERWGSSVVAVVAPADPGAPPSLENLRSHCRTVLAGYKIPKRLVVVNQVQRSPAGKPDYRWAAQVAETGADGENLTGIDS